jgi:hypothetical protein
MHQLIKHINFLNYASIHQPYKLQSSMNWYKPYDDVTHNKIDNKS